MVINFLITYESTLTLRISSFHIHSCKELEKILLHLHGCILMTECFMDLLEQFVFIRFCADFCYFRDYNEDFQ